MNKDQFVTEFELLRSSLKSYLLRFTASVQDTEDILQETWIKASVKINSFKHESSFKTWIFTIASNLAKDNKRANKRWVENVTDIAKDAAHSDPVFFKEAMYINDNSAHAAFEIKEHIAFCFTCIAKSLPLAQQVCLLLKEVYDFKINEIAQIIDSNEAMVKYHLHSARNKMMDIFNQRCALINKQGTCHQCSELNGIFNPKQKLQEELIKIEMVREAGKAGKEKLFDLRTQILQGIDPFKSNASELQLHHLEHNRKVMENFLEKTEA